MSLSTKPVSCQFHPATGGSGTHPKVLNAEMVKRLGLPSPQRVKKEGTLKVSSRREIVRFAASSLGFLCLILPEFAEARPRNADIRKKVLDKFQQLRKKAGLSNRTDEAEESKSTPKNES